MSYYINILGVSICTPIAILNLVTYICAAAMGDATGGSAMLHSAIGFMLASAGAIINFMIFCKKDNA